jgi:hypothetical protein
MKEISRFRVRDTRGNKYELVEYVEGDRSIFKTADGKPVNRIDRTNFEILTHNPRTNEPRIEVYR